MADLENRPSNVQDGPAFLQQSLKDLFIDVDSSNMSKSTFKAFEKLLHEREYWRVEATRFTDEVTRLQSQVATLKEDKDSKDLLVESLRRDEQVLNNRLSAMVQEHRELKNHWLAEKSDLQTRLFQIQALNTQVQGTLKKKDKDYDKLQAQLSKLVKDAGRGAAKPSIAVSVPLKKAFSQESSSSTAAALLKDAEVISLRNSLSALGKDNATLKASMEALQQELVRLQVLDGPLVAPTPAVPIAVEKVSAAAKEDPSPTEAEAETPPSSPLRVITKSEEQSEVPLPPLTPGVRSVRWLIDQTNTAVKELRQRADIVASNQLQSKPAKSSAVGESGEATQQSIVTLKERLTEALKVIEEQDRLIHEALLGKLPGQLQPDAIPAEIVWEDNKASEFAMDDHHYLVDSEVIGEDSEVRQLTRSARKLKKQSQNTNAAVIARTASTSSSAAPSNTTSRRTSFDIDEFLSMQEVDLLPPASPDTMLLLEQGGWHLPKNSFLLPHVAPPQSIQRERQRRSLGGLYSTQKSAKKVSTESEAEGVKPEILEF